MKNLINKVRHHGKKITIYLKSQPKWIVKSMFGIGAILGLVLSFHTHPIGGTNAQTLIEEEPDIQCLCPIGGMSSCGTDKKYSDVHHYTGNITYTDAEGSVFTGIGTITISSGDNIITMLDRNLGATTNDVGSTGSYGYTISLSGNIDNFIEDIQLCPDGFHVPSNQEWGDIINMLGNDGEYLSGELLLPYLGLWSSSPSNWCNVRPCDLGVQAIFAFTPVPVDCPLYSDTGRSLHGTPTGEYGIRCFYDKNQEYHPFIVNLYNGQNVIDNLEIWAGNDIILPILDNSGNSTFSGWFMDSGLTTPFDDSTTITGNLDLYAKWYDNTPPTCIIEYSTTGRTNQNVTATLTCDEDFVVTNNSGSTGYTFESTGTFLFEFKDLADNTGEKLAVVTGIDKTRPTCSVSYDITGTTTGDVIASLTGCSETITGTDLQHTFTGNGSYTFRFQDLAGNTGSTEAEVTGIDKNNPTCNVVYSTTRNTTSNVIASLTGCSETITGTTLQHTFTGNGSYTFEFQDLFGNTGSKNAEVTWISTISYDSGANITYTDTEGNVFTGIGIITITNGTSSISMLDRNLGATTNDITKTGSYGYHFQWGNNYGFESCYISGCYGFPNEERTGSTRVSGITRYGPDTSWYVGSTFILTRESPYDWASISNDNLWGGSGDNVSNNRGYPVTDPTNRQGPCPNGFHVPSYGEILKVKDMMDIGDFHSKLLIPFAGTRSMLDAQVNGLGNFVYGFLWSSSTYNSDYRGARSLSVYTGQLGLTANARSYGFSVRCFKNSTGYNSSRTGHNSAKTGITFSISIDDTINAGEYTDFTVKVMEDGSTYRNYTGTVHFKLTDKKGNTIDRDLYDFSGGRSYMFNESDRGKKIFKNGLKIKKAGTYELQVYDSSNDNIEGSEIVVVKTGHSSAGVEYDTSKFNPNYSDEMNKAYQYAYNYRITTQSTIKQANMTGSLNRIAMAKMLTNYAVNVLGKDNFDTSRNCSFKDVSTSLDRQYDNGVTKACQLGIMGINMPNNNFNPYGTVTRAEFATALSRLLFGTEDGANKYYSTHISKLYNEGIITKTDPTLKELRGYVMLMLMRAGK